MKLKTIYSAIIAALAVVAIVGCQQNEIAESAASQTAELRFDPTLGSAQTATRAGESDNRVLQVGSAAGVKPPHIVIETYTGEPGGALQKYFSDELGYFKSGNYWEVNSGKKRFLPTGGMHLYAYFATDFAEKGDLTNVVYTHPTAAGGYPKLAFTPDATDALHQVDLIAAKIEKITNPNILVPFRHILSQVNFGVKGIDRHQITVSNIRINNVAGEGVFDYNTWSWVSEKEPLASYPYFFPDRTDRNPTSGLGETYKTTGEKEDSKYIYIFGDGGKFGPGADATIRYAQTSPAIVNYATKQETPEPLHNALMLIPQAITQNSKATVTFDFEITIDGRKIRSGKDQVVSLNPYYDWRPNLRYVYLFDFEDPSEEIRFDVWIDQWRNWDSDGQDSGIKNGTIQQPTQATLNTIGDDETIYLLGLLERDLLWDWSDGAKYTFANINTLTLDFSGVETRTYSVEIRVPEDKFTIEGQNPATTGKLIISRKQKILLEPSPKQLNTRKKNDSFVLYGALDQDLTWNWRGVDFAALKQNEAFALDFSGVTFNVGKRIELQLPLGITAAGSGVSNVSTTNNPNAYIISTAATVTITDHRVSPVIAPSDDILNVVSDNSIVGVNGGTVGNAGDKWNWSGYTFANLDPQENFNVVFSNVAFNTQAIEIALPDGFRVLDGPTLMLNPYSVRDNGTVTIKNNRINYPTATQVNALSGGNTVELAGEKLTTDAPLNWSIYEFPNLTPQTSFTLDVTKIDFFQPLTITLPNYFVLSGGTGISGSNPYTLTQKTSINILNDKIQKPSEVQLTSLINDAVIRMSGGQLFQNEKWDWRNVNFSALGGAGKLFKLIFELITFNGFTIEIKLPNGFTASGDNVTSPTFGTYLISGNTTVTIVDNRRSVTGGNPSLVDVAAGERVVLTGTVSGAQSWTWAQMPTLQSGEWFEIDYSQTNADGANPLYLPTAGATYAVSGDYVLGWAYLFYKRDGYTDGIVRFTNVAQYNFPTLNDTNPNIGDTLVLPTGTMYGPYAWGWWKWLPQGDGSHYSVSFANITFVGEITIYLSAGYLATATANPENVIINGTTLTVKGKCTIKVTYP